MTTTTLQFTDLHLQADPADELRGVRTHDTFVRVLQSARDWAQENARADDGEPILLTGDLAHDGRPETYKRLRDLLGDWLSRCHLIPGNHDNREAIRAVFPEVVADDADFISFSVDAAGWRLVGLDSLVEGETYGKIARQQLDWLERQLSQHPDQPTMLFLHHPPFPVQSAWLDRIALRNPDELLEIVSSQPQVRVISAGHVHQEFSNMVDGLQMLTSPSTGVQFLPQSDELVIHPAPPGFRVFQLSATDYETLVIRPPAH